MHHVLTIKARTDSNSLHLKDMSGYEIRLQGQLLTWKDRSKAMPPDTGKCRGRVYGFSRDSRLRMMKTIATIDWEKAKPVLFLTVTYPDECGEQTNKTVGVHRAVLWRYIEKYLKKQTCCIWRIEWKPRLSGVYESELMPHLHFLILNTRWIDKDDVKVMWGKAINYDGIPVTWIEEADEEDTTAFYVAKYCEKAGLSVLDNAAYHNTPSGRQWGILRKELVPFCPEYKVIVPVCQLIDDIKDVATSGWVSTKIAGFSSFTLFGRRATETGEKIFGKDETDGKEA